jgi:hypothetical protein
VLERLIGSAGAWQGTSTLQDPGRLEPDSTPSTLTVTPMLGGRFVRLDYTWSYKDAAQSGSLLVGHQKKSGALSIHWIDSWHNSDNVMALTGQAETPTLLTVKGSYAAPPGPDWGWKIAITPESDGRLRLVMHNISPEGQEYLAVEAEYARA